MSYLVFCTFDLKGASQKDYENAYSDLSDLGLEKIHKGSKGGDVVIPTTSVMGSTREKVLQQSETTCEQRSKQRSQPVASNQRSSSSLVVTGIGAQP